MFRAGPSAPVSYVTRGDRRIMLVRPAPSIEPHLLQTESILPIQFTSSARRTGERALLVRLLTDALADAGLLAGGRWHRRADPRRCALATRWLLGEFDAHVALPVRLVCDALGLDAGVLATAVARAHASGGNVGQEEANR